MPLLPDRLPEAVLLRLAAAAELCDPRSGPHVARMSRLCESLAARLGFSRLRCRAIRLASALHDLGKAAVPSGLLLKRGPLTPAEFVVVRRHAELGGRLLESSEHGVLRLAAAIAWTHHERYDGKGYPRGLRGRDIPVEGRVAAVADVFDALVSRRAYKPAFPVAQAVAIMRQDRGRRFDPLILDAFLEGLG